MSTVTFRVGRFAFALLLLSSVLVPSGRAFAQDDEFVGVDGNTWTSPTFDFSLEWDDEIWTVIDAFSEDEYDSISLESAGANVYVDGVYFYQGDPESCLEGERVGIANDSDLDDLDTLTDDDGNPLEEIGDGWAYGIYELPDASGDALNSIVYLECRNLIPDSAVLILTAFMDPDDLDAQFEAIAPVFDSIESSDSEIPATDSADIEQSVRTVATEIDAFWEATFVDLGSEYRVPAYITFLEPIETGCGDATPGFDGPFYCPADETVYLDLEDLTGGLLPYGLIVVDMVVAHEIGHHVQEVLQLTGCFQEECGVNGNSLAIELQADCLAGAWMGDAAANGSIQPRELQRVETGIKDYLADPPGTAADDPEAHGDGDTRFGMFMAGFTDGITACGIE